MSALYCTVAVTLGAEAQVPSGSAGADADQLYAQRETLANAVRAAALWSARPASDFDAAWKLARADYWIGTHAPDAERRPEAAAVLQKILDAPISPDWAPEDREFKVKAAALLR